jgi:PII-like signaling protein
MRSTRISIVTDEGDQSQGELLQRKPWDGLKQQGVTIVTATTAIVGYSKSDGITNRSLC